MESEEGGSSSGQGVARVSEKGRPPRGQWTRRGIVETALIAAGPLLHFLLLPHYVIGDGYVRYQMLVRLLAGHDLATAKYSLIGPLFAVPLWYFASLASAPLVGVIAFNTIVFALALIAFYWALSPVMDHHLVRVFLMLLTFASMFSYQLEHFYGEVFTAALAAVGLMFLVLRGARTAFAGAVFITLGVANIPATVVAIALAMGQRIWQTRRLRYALLVLTPVALILIESWARRGSPLAIGYSQDHGPVSIMPFSGQPGFSYPFLFGLLAILLSFGKGLVFYVPGMFLPVRSRIAQLGVAARPLWTMYSLWLWFVVGLILVYAKWWAWSGDWFWGPRFFVFACVPASFALALWTQRPSARLSLNLLALLTLALSVWVGIDGPVFDQATLGACLANDGRLIAYCEFTPDFSALWRPIVNADLYGIGPRFMAVEGLNTNSLAYACLVLLIGAYVSAPLMRAIWSQSRMALAAWWPRLVGTLAALRF